MVAAGGVLDLEEMAEDGLFREAWEETDVRVSVDRLTRVYKNMTRCVVQGYSVRVLDALARRPGCPGARSIAAR